MEQKLTFTKKIWKSGGKYIVGQFETANAKQHLVRKLTSTYNFNLIAYKFLEF